MNPLLRKAAFAAAFCATHGAVLADPVEEKNVLAGKAKLDSAQGYVFVQAPNRVYGVFLRVPDGETRVTYQQDWDKAFEKAKKKYVSALKNWEFSAASARKTGAKVPDRPIEPTIENFTIDAIELRDQVSFGPMYVYRKAESRFDYLTAVKPGTYIYYGPLLLAPGQPPAGICNCMGSVKFEVRPGVVTDVGTYLYAAPQPAPPYDFATLAAMRLADERKAEGKADADPLLKVAFGLPESLKSWPSAQAEFHASGKLNNYYGMPITRIAPIPGVIGYRRDTAIDLRTNADIPSALIVTQARIKK